MQLVNNRSQVTAQEINEARDKVLYGKERRSLEMDDNEKRSTAYHEAGHTVVALKVKHSDPGGQSDDYSSRDVAWFYDVPA